MLNRKPRKGDIIHFDTYNKDGSIKKLNQYLGKVDEVKGNICYLDEKDSYGDRKRFIWKFTDGNKETLNQLAIIKEN